MIDGTWYPHASSKLINGRRVVLRCPYCGRKHYHGGGLPSEDPKASLGHKTRHCDPKQCNDLPDHGYILVEAEQSPLKR